jgi:hypothetical protein
MGTSKTSIRWGDDGDLLPFDDEPEYIEVDDDDDDDGDWWQRYDTSVAGERPSVAGFWGKYGKVVDQTNTASRVEAAQRVVQGFVDTFATGDARYRVTFDESVKTAGTDFKAKVVAISHKPLFDPTLSSDEAETVLTAMAVHESSHVRYGRRTAKAVEDAFAASVDAPAAKRISNILDDIRIERRFVEDYPGYAEVFAPAIAYVARPVAGIRGQTLPPIDRILGATRYGAHVDWTDAEATRDFWLDWAKRGTANDTTRTHVEAVKEAIAVLRAQQQQRKEQEREAKSQDAQGQGQPSEAPKGERSDQSGQSASLVDDADAPVRQSGASDVADLDDEDDEDDANEVDADDLESATRTFGSDCFADGANEQAEANGETSGMDSASAQQLVEDAKALVDDGNGGRGEVYWTPEGIARGSAHIDPSHVAAASIRSAFMRSRTGHYGVARQQRSGRIDNRGITRLVESDYRIFNRHAATSEGKYLVWLLVDCSGSMAGYPIWQATSVAQALGIASRGLPNVRMDIWGWTTGQRIAGSSFAATRVWSSGQSIDSIGKLPRIPDGGTPDKEVLGWARRAIKLATRPDEQPVIIIASDGQGSLAYRETGDATEVEKARKDGVQVVSVAFGYGLEKMQARLYGDKGFVPFAGSITATAGPLGALVARVATGQQVG